MTSTLKIDTIEPEGATTTLTVGESGQNTVIAGAGIKANVMKDAGANAVFTSNGSGVLSGVNAGFASPQVLIQSQTADNSASISFTSGLDSTYMEYIFDIINVQPLTDGAYLQIHGSTDAGSSWTVNIQDTFYASAHSSGGAGGWVAYQTDRDIALGYTAKITDEIGGNATPNAECAALQLHLFSPSSTALVKNWYLTGSVFQSSSYANRDQLAGYFDTTSALTGIKFDMTAGNIDDGTFNLYGIK